MGLKSSLSGLGIVWSLLTCLTIFSSCFGFYMQFWLIGSLPNNQTTQFNLFRRCNYYERTQIGQEITKTFVDECGRYATFSDIPNVGWQIAVVMAAVGICLLMFTAFLSVFACCLEYFNRMIARVCGFIQAVSGRNIFCILLFYTGHPI